MNILIHTLNEHLIDEEGNNYNPGHRATICLEECSEGSAHMDRVDKASQGKFLIQSI